MKVMNHIFMLLLVSSLLSCGKEPGQETPEKTKYNEPEPYQIEIATAPGEVYRHDPDLKIYFLYPERELKDGEKLPTILFFFGGGWTSGNVNAFAGQGKEFADKGMVVGLVDYRVKNRYGNDPSGCVQDAKSAMRYVRANAERLHVDPDKIIASGGSAGGHLALSLAYVQGFDAAGDDLSISTVPQALILFNPVVSNAAAPDGYGYNMVKDYFPAISPYHNINAAGPPTLTMIGTADEYVSMKTIKEFNEKLSFFGTKSELVFYDGAKHGFFNWSVWNKAVKLDPYAVCHYRLTLDKALSFTRELGWIE